MRMIFGLSMCTVLCVFLKVNNMCSCENHVVICDEPKNHLFLVHFSVLFLAIFE